MKINLTAEINDEDKLHKLYNKIVEIKNENEEIESMDQALTEHMIKDI